MTYREQVQEQLKNILLKLLFTIQSRKFWAFVFGVVTVLTQLQGGTIDGPTAIAAVVGLIATYSGFTAWEDIAAAREARQ